MRRLARAPAMIFGLLLVALVGGALFPRNAGWREAEAGVSIGVDSTLVHTEIVVPVSALEHDWGRLLPPGALGPGPPPRYLGFSWGDRDFFLATPDWADVRPGPAMRALVASRGSLVHLYRLEGPRGRPVRLTPAQYGRLSAHLAGEIAPGAPIPGYGTDDIFLPGTGRYSALRTCNQWVADALAAAGVGVGLWTPFPQSLMWRFDDKPGEA